MNKFILIILLLFSNSLISKELEKISNKNSIYNLLGYEKLLLIILFIFIFILYRQRQLRKHNHNLEKINQKLKLNKIELLNQSIRNKHLNETLENKVKEEVRKNRERDKHMIQQSRLAQMGEMISMIAHQWRQPLSAISSTSGALNIKAKLNKADNDLIVEYTNKILEYSQHLSSTIDDFREFFKPNKEKKQTNYNEIVESVLSIVGTSIKNKNIILIKELNCKDSFLTYHNEVKQVILNIIKNAEDIFLEKNIKEPIIKILTRKEDNNYILEIIDNGGGIDENIIDKIFDPYFSTKTKKNGTGLGLYMSKVIIEDHCGGSLSVSNKNNKKNKEIEDNKYFLIKGVTHISTVFKIIIQG